MVGEGAAPENGSQGKTSEIADALPPERMRARRSTAMDNNCLRCGHKVRPEENWVKVELWASIAVFDRGCFIALLKSQCPEAAAQAAWQSDGRAPPTGSVPSNGERGSTK
jgi:hypothetical protein